MENAATLLKLEAESEVRMGFKYSRPSSLEPLGRLEASSEGSLQCGSGNFKETGLFAAADKGLLSLEGKLNFSQVFSKVKCFQKALQLGTSGGYLQLQRSIAECAFVSRRMNSGVERCSEKNCSVTKTS